MKYDVHLYVACRVKIEGIEAASQEEAIKKAEEQFEPSQFFHGDDAREAAIWDEGPALGALVDEEGDPEYDKSGGYHECNGAQLYLKQDNFKLLNGGETKVFKAA